jgi:hypothetical protein
VLGVPKDRSAREVCFALRFQCVVACAANERQTANIGFPLCITSEAVMMIECIADDIAYVSDLVQARAKFREVYVTMGCRNYLIVFVHCS